MNKKRVAICFFGQTRTFQVINNTYKKLQDDKIHFDFKSGKILLTTKIADKKIVHKNKAARHKKRLNASIQAMS